MSTVEYALQSLMVKKSFTVGVEVAEGVTPSGGPFPPGDQQDCSRKVRVRHQLGGVSGGQLGVLRMEEEDAEHQAGRGCSSSVGTRRKLTQVSRWQGAFLC
jgi:hypothetical protein